MAYGTKGDPGKLRQRQDECEILLQAMLGSQSEWKRLLVLDVQCSKFCICRFFKMSYHAQYSVAHVCAGALQLR